MQFWDRTSSPPRCPVAGVGCTNVGLKTHAKSELPCTEEMRGSGSVSVVTVYVSGRAPAVDEAKQTTAAVSIMEWMILRVLLRKQREQRLGSILISILAGPSLRYDLRSSFS